MYKLLGIAVVLMGVGAIPSGLLADSLSPKPIALSLDQRIGIGEIITNKEKVPLTSVDFPIPLGGTIPEHVRLRPLAPDMAAIA
jgi:hypothetical protein